MRKRLFAYILTVAVLFGGSLEVMAETAKAVPVVSNVSMNGSPARLSAYNIEGYNYFKLRDIAMLLSGTEKDFSVSSAAGSGDILLSFPAKYAPAGGELAVTEETAAKEALAAEVSLTVNGEKAAPAIYNIDGYNYFKLRDLMSLLNVGLGWDSEENLITIDTALGYSEESQNSLPLFYMGSFYLTPEFCGMYIADTYDTTLAKITDVTVLGAEVALDEESPALAEYTALSGTELQEVKNALGNNVRTAVKIFHAFPEGKNAEIRLYVRVTGADGITEDHCYVLEGEITGYWDMSPDEMPE